MAASIEARSDWSTNMATGRCTAARHLEHLVEHVPVRILEIDDDDFGVDLDDPRAMAHVSDDGHRCGRPRAGPPRSWRRACVVIDHQDG